MPKIETAEQVKRFQEHCKSALDRFPIVVSLCNGTACCAMGAKELAAAFEKELAGDESVKFIKSGCHGFCEVGPLVVVRPLDVVYQRVKPDDVPEIVDRSLRHNEVIDRLLYRFGDGGKVFAKEGEIPFYSNQSKVVLALNSLIDPYSIDDYLAYGGYSALARALEMTPDAVLKEITDANLRGRGGGGFDAGRKWNSCRTAAGERRHIVCNADEGDPGAFMDESILEGNPHSVIEGMVIGAWAIGGDDGFIYIRNEYPRALKAFGNALKQAREYGFLGENILSSGLDFDIKVSRGGGAFVCGESSALFRSLEGEVGEPRAKYVHSVERGYRDEPTNLNNVETWANVPHIINRGAEWFRSTGTKDSPGTKVFSLVGKVENTGLIEVPMGITLREIIFDIGGGIKGGKNFKAVQTGGPSGGCLPASSLDLPVDFDVLTRAGSMMGSGGMIVMDEETCVVDVAKYFTDFLIEESCGKCLPCREGLMHMSGILHRITEGKGKPEDLRRLVKLGDAVAAASLCGLGVSAPNPVLSSIRYFEDEYLAHINEHRCPGSVCSALISYHIDPAMCTGCGTCEKVCPVDAIKPVPDEERKDGLLREIDADVCEKCSACKEVCPEEAIVVESPAVTTEHYRENVTEMR
ncbi:4Fe-4S binding protein [bacterium]|nr:4Fe-4S binding protein [bacterium]